MDLIKYFIKNPSRLLPNLFALITRKDRYRVDIEWSNKSWVHNIFRVYELIFWRRFGIRAESASYVTAYQGGSQEKLYELYTFEATCAHIETLIREFFKIHWLDIRVTHLQFAFPVNTPELRIPWISFAIALDATSTGTSTSTSPVTISHTITGSNTILITSGESFSLGSTTISTPTYNSVSENLLDTTKTVGTNGLVGLWYLLNPTTGANTVSMAFGGSTPFGCIGSVSWSGVSQTGQPDAVQGATGTSNNPSTTITTVADNSWVAGVLGYFSVSTATAGLTSRSAYVTRTSTKANLEDTNGPKTPAGNQTVNWTITSPGTWGITAASFAPAGAGGSVIKTFFGLANASTKTITGLANASTKTFDGTNNV